MTIPLTSSSMSSSSSSSPPLPGSASSSSHSDRDKGTHQKTRMLPQLIIDNGPRGYRRPSDRVQSPRGCLKKLDKEEEKKIEAMRRVLGPSLASPTPPHSPTESSSSSSILMKKYDRYFLKAKRHFKKEEWCLALKFLNPLLSKYPSNLPALEMRLSIYYRSLKQTFAALSDCNRILAINPRHEQALIIRMKVQFELGFYIGAKKDAQYFLNHIDEDDLEAIQYIGAIFVHENNPESAIRNLLEVWEEEPEDTFTMLYLARAYHQLEDNTKAFSFLNIILQENPLHTQALLIKAKILIETNSLSQAEATLSKIKIENQNKEYTELLQRITVLKRKNCKCIIC